MGRPALKCHRESTLSSQGVTFSLLGLPIKTAWGKHAGGQLQCWLLCGSYNWEGGHLCTQGEEETSAPQANAPKERFGPSDSMGNGHIWLLVTSESVLSMFLSCFNLPANLRQVGQQGEVPKISSSCWSFALPKTSEMFQRKRTRIFPHWPEVSAYTDSPHLKSTPRHNSSANQVSVVLLSKELTALLELLWVISL